MKLRLLLIIMCLAICLIPVAMISGVQGFQIATMFLGLIVATTLTVGYVISYFISRPLVTLTKNINEISKGNLDVELEESEIDEINDLTKSLDRVMASLKLAIHKVGVKKEEIFEEILKAKEEAEQRFEYVLKKIDGWIWEVDEKGTCTVCSAKVATTLGYAPEQVIGTDIFHFLPEKESLKLKELMKSISKETEASAVQLDLYWVAQNKDHPIWVRSCLIPVFDQSHRFRGVRCFSRDASELHEAHNQIQQLNQKISELEKQIHDRQELHHLQPPYYEPHLEIAGEQEFDYMFIFDENAKIVECTNDIQKKLGYKKEEMLQLTLADVSYLESYEEVKACLATIKKQGVSDLKTIHRKKDGSSLFVSEHIRFLKDRNLFICLVKEDTL